MPDFREQLGIVTQVRQERQNCDEKLYQTRLLIQRAENRLRYAHEKRTLPNVGNQKQIETLKVRKGRLQALLSELNRELVALEGVFQKVRDAEQLMAFLQNKLKTLETQMGLTRESIAKAEQEQNFEEIEKLKLVLLNLEKQFKETQADLERAKQERERLHQAENQALEKKKDIENRQAGLRHELEALDNQLRDLSSANFHNTDEVRHELEILRGRENALMDELRRCDKSLFGHIGRLYVEPHPREILKNIGDMTPFLLFPVKIETRFVENDGRPQLWVRVYPDEIAVHTHEKTLTDNEVENGKLYWTELLVAQYCGTGKEDRSRAAWSHIANLYKGQRAAWVAQQMKPTDWDSLAALPGINSVFDLLKNKDANFFSDIENNISDPSVKQAFQNAVAAENVGEFFKIAEKYKYTEGVNKTAQQWITTFPVHDLTKPDAWSRAPRTRIMPDKFVITLYRGTTTREIIGRPIPDTLYVGPNPAIAQDEITKTADKIVFAESFDWIMDFPQAVELGVGFRIALSQEEARGGFDKIVALGLYLSATENDSAAMLDELIDSHHYSPKGFSLVPQGTPTNNTERNGAGYTDNDDFNDISYFVETGDPLFNGEIETDGQRLADALNLKYETLQYVRHADKNDFGEAVAMNTALYPATLGYYLEALLSPVVSQRDRDRVRLFFTQYATGRGKLPAIRVGNQPYGILITSDFSSWKVHPNEERRFVLTDFIVDRQSNFLSRLHSRLQYFENEFNRQLNKVSYIGKPTTPTLTSAKILMDVLGLQASSVEFYQRIGYAYDVLASELNFKKGGKFADDMANLRNFATVITNFLETNLGYVFKEGDKQAKVLQLLYQHFHLRLNAGNLIDDQVLSEDPAKSKAKDYIKWLAETNDVAALEKQDFGTKPTPTSLLYMLLRNALLLNLYHGVYDWLNTRFKFDTIPMKNKVFTDSMYAMRAQVQPTPWEYMHAKIGNLDAADPLSNFTAGNYLLLNRHEEREGFFLAEMKESLAVLEKMSTAALERCFIEHLDMCSYRLDAWQTGMFTHRLESIRQNRDEGNDQMTTGTMLGAYGYVENVRPANNRRVLADTIPVKLRPQTGEIFEYPLNKSGGFVHAPSINHASAAAVLRAGYLSHANTTNPDLLAVNLSSERVRRAMFLLDGLRNGQLLEALLGYQFERALHDRFSVIAGDLNKYILDFRIAFPISQRELPQQGTGDATESLPPYNVVNGLTLIAQTDWTKVKFIDVPSVRAVQIFNEEKDRLKDSLDAIKDLLMAENFYQLIMGNFDRVAAVNLAQKEAHYPTDLQVLETPRSALLTFTNRVTLHFENTPSSFNPWTAQGISMTPRAQAEAGVNKWLAAIIGDPSVYRCEISLVKKEKDVNGIETETLENTQEVGLQEVNLQAIDLVYLVGNEIETVGATELEARLAQVYRLTYVLSDSEIVRISFNKPDTQRRISQLLPLLRRLRTLIAESRPINAQDFTPSSRQDVLTDATNPKGFDIVDLKNRIEIAHTQLKNGANTLENTPVTVQIGADVLTTLKQAIQRFETDKIGFDTKASESYPNDVITTFSTGDFYSLKNTLSDITLFGFTNAFPKIATGFSDVEKLEILKQAQVVFKETEKALKEYDTLSATLKPELSLENQVEILLKTGKLVLGEIFNILPRFSYQNYADIALADSERAQLLSFNETKTGLDADTIVEEWLEGMARVRPKLHKWELIRTLADALNDTPLQMQPIQVPYQAKNTWLAVEFPDKDPNDATKPFQILRDTISIVAHGATAYNAPSSQSGILLDDWTEQIPTAEETTGIAFHYNQPNAMPPQTLLLCVSPELKGGWDWNALMDTINDTFARAKRRAIEPEHLEFPFNPEKQDYDITWTTLLPALVGEFTTLGTNLTLDYALNLKFEALATIYKLKIT